jgi:hypothetical protein
MRRLLLAHACLLLLPAVAGAKPAKVADVGCRSSTKAQEAAPKAPVAGARIGEVLVRNVNVFDVDLPDEDRWPFRLANRLHRRTRIRVICRQLLFAPGEPFDPQTLAESERILRSNHYLHDAEVRPVAIRDSQGVPEQVDVGVTTRDDWTLALGLGIGRSGGANETHLTLRDANFLGTGRYLSLARDSSVDRDETAISFIDDNLLGRHGRLEVEWSDNSDGQERHLALGRPFYALASRWAAGLDLQQTTRVDRRYSLGHPFDAFGLDRAAIEAWGGWSRGLNAAGRTTRYTLGFTRTEDRFHAVPGTSVDLPRDQAWSYLWAGVELAQDSFRKEQNLDQMGRTEDVFLGHRARLRLGLARSDLGKSSPSQQQAAGYLVSSAEGGSELSAATTLLYSAAASGRLTSDGGENVMLSAGARLLHRDFGHHLLVASLSADAAHDLDAGAQLLLGGDSGLRGYPLRYQDGDARVLLTLEQRYFTKWYPFSLVHVGAAAFADVGRTFGDPAIPANRQGWLGDVGVGLRLSPSRSSLGAVIHLDLAMPVGGDPTIERVQWLVRTRSSF